MDIFNDHFEARVINSVHKQNLKKWLLCTTQFKLIKFGGFVVVLYKPNRTGGSTI